MIAIRALTFHHIGSTDDFYGTSVADYHRLRKICTAAKLRIAGLRAFETLSNNSKQIPSQQKNRDVEHCIVVTYDDAYENIFDPVLQLPPACGVLFPIADYVGKYNDWNRRAPRRMRHLSWSQLGDLVKAGFDIGSHTCAHWNLERLSDKEVGDELRRSQEILQDRLGVSVKCIAYPYGEASSRIRFIAARYYEWGFLSSVRNHAALKKSPMDRLAIPRRSISTSILTKMQDSVLLAQLRS
jgi:peptidoglycan/xylan/chitin deacetylase (PgdA/CDA1 family)